MNHTLTTVVLLAVIYPGNVTAGLIRFENFDSDPGWTSVGSGLNGNDFGFQTTSNAGGLPGEAGGRSPVPTLFDSTVTPIWEAR